MNRFFIFLLCLMFSMQAPVLAKPSTGLQLTLNVEPLIINAAQQTDYEYEITLTVLTENDFENITAWFEWPLALEASSATETLNTQWLGSVKKNTRTELFYFNVVFQTELKDLTAVVEWVGDGGEVLADTVTWYSQSVQNANVIPKNTARGINSEQTPGLHVIKIERPKP